MAGAEEIKSIIDKGKVEALAGFKHSLGTEALGSETTVSGGEKRKTRKTKPELTILSDEEKDKKIENFFGKGVTTGVVTEEPDKVMESIRAQLKAAAEVGDEEEIKKLEEEIKKHKEKLKTGEELFEEAQAFEAGKGHEENENILRKEKEVELARKKYAGADYETTNILSRIKEVLGIKVSKEKNDSVNYAYGEYQAKLLELIDAKIEHLKSSNLGDNELKKEMGDLVKYFNFDEKLNLYDSKTTARAEAKKDKFGGKIFEWSSKLVNNYRKMPQKYKYAIAAALFMAGGGLGTAATVAGYSAASLGALGVSHLSAGAGFAAVSAYRGLSGAATGAATTAGLEAFYRGKERKKSNKDVEKTIADMEKAEEKFEFLTSKLKFEIETYDKSLKQERVKGRERRLAGVAVGLFLGSGVASKLFGSTIRSAFEHFHGTGAGHIPSGVPMPEDTGVHEAGTVSPDNAPGGVGASEVIPPIEKTIDLPAIKEGGGIEGSIIKHLTDNPDLMDKYNEQLGGGRKFDAGQIAHRMFEEYGDKRDLVHAGAQVQLSPDGLHIQGVAGDESIGFLHESAPAGIPTEPEIEVAPDNIPPEANIFPENPGFDRVHESVFGHNTDNFLDGAERELFNAERGYGGNYGPAASPTPGPGVDSDWFKGMEFSRGIFSDFRDKIIAGNPEEATKFFREKIAPDDVWDKIKSMTFSEATVKMGWNEDGKMETFFKNMKKILGDSVRPKIGLGGETMESWTKRVAETAIEQANKKY